MVKMRNCSRSSAVGVDDSVIEVSIIRPLECYVVPAERRRTPLAELLSASVVLPCVSISDCRGRTIAWCSSLCDFVRSCFGSIVRCRLGRIARLSLIPHCTSAAELKAPISFYLGLNCSNSYVVNCLSVKEAAV